MATPETPRCDDQLLTQYLLGAVSPQETERLDELSIADDQVAWQLRAVENDLVDAYVRGELSKETRGRFEAVYLTTPKRLEKVKFAESFLSSADLASITVSARPPHQPWILSWAFAAAAVLLTLTSAYLVFSNRRLQTEVDQARAENSRLNQSDQALRKEIAGRDTKPSDPAQPAAPVVALLLFPQSRGAGSIAAIALPPAADRVELHLVLETDDFATYSGALKDPATGQLLMRSPSLKSSVLRENKTVSIQIPAGVLKPQNYTVELFGAAPGKPGELVHSYAFRVTSR